MVPYRDPPGPPGGIEGGVVPYRGPPGRIGGGVVPYSDPPGGIGGGVVQIEGYVHVCGNHSKKHHLN